MRHKHKEAQKHKIVRGNKAHMHTHSLRVLVVVVSAVSVVVSWDEIPPYTVVLTLVFLFSDQRVCSCLKGCACCPLIEYHAIICYSAHADFPVFRPRCTGRCGCGRCTRTWRRAWAHLTAPRPSTTACSNCALPRPRSVSDKWGKKVRNVTYL